MPPISVMIKPASSLCNMSCRYCFYCDEASKRERSSYGFMSEETLKNVIRRTLLRAEHSISYAYQGGEPTLRGLDFFKQAAAYQKQYNQRGIRVSNALQTNGYAIDEAWCGFLRENNFLVGLSIDGTRELHDALRRDKNGGGTYDRVLRAAKLFDQNGVQYNILTVVTAGLARSAETVYREYQRRGWRYQQYIACLDPLGEPCGSSEFSLLPEDYGSFLAELFRLWYADVKRGTQPYIRQFENYAGLAAGIMAESCDQRGTCSVQYVVEADGSVYPCDFYMLDACRLGNFNTDHLERIDAARKASGFIERSLKLDEMCRTCRYAPLCRGGCQRHREPVPGTERYRNYFCKGYQLFFEESYDKLMELGTALAKARRVR